MTFTAKPVALREVDQFPVVQSQFITVFRIMTVETPAHCFGMMEFDLRVFLLQLPFLSIHLHAGMAIAARKHSFCHGGRGDRKLLTRAVR